MWKQNMWFRHVFLHMLFDTCDSTFCFMYFHMFKILHVTKNAPFYMWVLATPHVSSSQSKLHTSADDPLVEVQGTAITDPANEATDHAKSDSTRTSGRSTKPTRFFDDPLCHSIKSVTESLPIESSQQLPAPEQTHTTPFVPLVRKGVQLPFPRMKEQTTPFRRIRIEEPENNS